MTERWRQRPPGSNWGEFGADDEFGRLNLLTPERLCRAVAEVREGRAFCLSLPLDLPGGNILNPRRDAPRLEATLQDGAPTTNFPMDRIDPANTDVLNDDRVTLSLQYSTQWDALGHIGAAFDADGDGVPEPVYYNGFRAGEHVTEPHRLGALAVDRLAVRPLQGRGVLVDLAAEFGPGRTVVGHAGLIAALATQGAVIEAGDILVVRTGFAERLVEMAGHPDKAVLDETGATLDGRDTALLEWITETGLAAIACDNYAVEQYPARPSEGRRPALPLHEHCLFKLGIPLGELWYLGELADWLRGAGRTRFLLTAAPLRLPGAAGSPVTPVATV
ncbi:MAG: cyclase family protein [Alphaproteobacteria bacterium]|nr:cyclase family protein [Alphaproteobacteria bacterium]